MTCTVSYTPGSTVAWYPYVLRTHNALVDGAIIVLLCCQSFILGQLFGERMRQSCCKQKKLSGRPHAGESGRLWGDNHRKRQESAIL